MQELEKLSSTKKTAGQREQKMANPLLNGKKPSSSQKLATKSSPVNSLGSNDENSLCVKTVLAFRVRSTIERIERENDKFFFSSFSRSILSIVDLAGRINTVLTRKELSSLKSFYSPQGEGLLLFFFRLEVSDSRSVSSKEGPSGAIFLEEKASRRVGERRGSASSTKRWEISSCKRAISSSLHSSFSPSKQSCLSICAIKSMTSSSF